MKQFKRVSQLVLLVLILSSCGISISTGGGADGRSNLQKTSMVSETGNVITTNRLAGQSFNGIVASGGLRVFLKQSATPSVKVKADENVQSVIVTTIEEGVLKVYPNASLKKKHVKEVYIEVVHLNSLKVSSGVLLMTSNTVETKDLSIKATSGCDVIMDLNCKNIICKVTSGALVKLMGNTNVLTVNSTSGCSVNAMELYSKKCVIKATSGSSVRTSCAEVITAKATSGASVKYYGKPSNVNINKTSGGSVIRK